MAHRPATDISSTDLNLNLPVPAEGLRISLFDQPSLPSAATAALTWICLVDGPAARKA